MEGRRYTSKSQYQKMKQLTYHHIREKSKGGKATVENGALLSEENHAWFNKQSKQTQRRMNEIFQMYKIGLIEITAEGIVQAKCLDLGDIDINDCITIPLENDNEKYNRAKAKREFRRIVQEELSKEEFDREV